jgi:Mg/Co/Ni transporter MgtE
MSKITIEIDKRQIERAINQLKTEEKLEILDELARETRKERWESLVSTVRKRYQKTPVSSDEIKRACEDVRKKQYEKKAKSSN